MATITVPDDVYERARRAATLEGLTVETLAVRALMRFADESDAPVTLSPSELEIVDRRLLQAEQGHVFPLEQLDERLSEIRVRRAV